MPDGIKQHSEMEQCAHLCHECQDACLGLIPHCLALGGAHSEGKHIGLLMDCAAACNAAHNLLHRGSPMHRHSCRACAEICAECATDCDQLAEDDPKMQECAEACRRCAASCLGMSA